MSGLKYSNVYIEEQIRKKQEIISQIENTKAEIFILKDKGKNIIGEFSQGIKEEFKMEIEKFKSWQKNKIPNFSFYMYIHELQAVKKEMEEFKGIGMKQFKALLEIKEKAPKKIQAVKKEMEEFKGIGMKQFKSFLEIKEKTLKKIQALKNKMEELSIILKSIEILSTKWHLEEYAEIEKAIDLLSHSLEEEKVSLVESEIEKLNLKINKMKETLNGYENLNKQRQYVLESLRKVCKQIGWEEIKEPYFEKKDDPRSRIIYEINTYSAGIMKFYLTLEKIVVNSPLTNENNYCIKEFNNLSEKLKNFGVNTKFKRDTAENEDPMLYGKNRISTIDEESLENNR